MNFLSLEKEHISKRLTKYIFFRSESSCEYLIVVFSGFPKSGNPASYNYIRTIEEIDCNKLFILDNQNTNHSSGATYYLGYNQDNSVEESVLSLIEEKRIMLNISKEKVILAGSSKGAFAALYYSFKYCYGYAVAGAPQSYLGMFLLEQHKDSDIIEVAKFIAGDDEIVARKYLDELIFKTVEESDSHPKVFIHVGKGDRHYWKHVIPFINHLEKLDISYQLDLADYNSHSELVEYYPPYLLKTIRSIIGA